MMSFVRMLFFVVAALAAQAGPPEARSSHETLTWEELATHAGLRGLKAPTTLTIDRINDLGSILAIRAEIELTEENWRVLNRDDEFSLLRPWKSGAISLEDWKLTVDLTLPEEGKVKIEHLRPDAPAVVLHRKNPTSVRVYILGERPHDKHKCLYYFYTRE